MDIIELMALSAMVYVCGKATNYLKVLDFKLTDDKINYAAGGWVLTPSLFLLSVGILFHKFMLAKMDKQKQAVAPSIVQEPPVKPT